MIIFDNPVVDHPDDWKLQENLIFWILAARRTAKIAAKVANILISDNSILPFNQLSKYSADTLSQKLKELGMGCYKSKAKSLLCAVHSSIDLKSCSLTDLMNIYGVGPKTARCFLLHTRSGTLAAGLDTHVLKFLRNLDINAPKVTPNKVRYEQLERIFLSIADGLKWTPAQLDIYIWRIYNAKDQLSINSLIQKVKDSCRYLTKCGNCNSKGYMPQRIYANESRCNTQTGSWHLICPICKGAGEVENIPHPTTT